MRRKLAALLFTTALLATAACGTGTDNGTPGDPDQPDQVKVGVIPIVDVAPIYLGAKQGFFESRNIELDLTPAQGGAAIVPGVVGGEFHFGFSNVISMLLAQQQGLGIKVVSNGNNSTGVDGEDFGSLMVPADSDIQTAADLEGRTVAANTLQNIVDTVVRASIRKAGGDPAAVNFVELPFPEMAAALERGDVDAAYPVEPFQSLIRAQGGRSIAHSWVDAAPDLTVAVYFTSSQLLEDNPDLVRRFTEAMQESLAYANDNPDEVRAVLGEYTQIPAEVAATLTLPTWPAEINRASVQTLAELALGDGVLSTPPDLDALLP